VAGRIRDDSIAEVRQATDVVVLVGEYVTLRPGGGTRMKGLCPFHQEKTPSFTVDSTRGLFHCFGCSVGGDAIDFLMKQETLSFTEAVERLAHRAGIELRYEGRSAGERGSMGRKSRLVAAHTEAVDFYHQALVASPDGRPARAYLSSRGLDRAVAERFRLGWAPAGSWEALVGHLRGKGFRPEELTEAGLARTGGRGLRDAFHARVLFPIFDVAGDPVAFGGRLLDADEGRGPKYVNTAETPIWHKGRALYALNWAKTAIVQAGHAVVVEGYTDVIACHQAGVPQAVATCGTALRAEHFKLLGRFTDRVVLAFDADAAGGRAAGRGIAELVAAPEASLSAHVLTMPSGLDPAEYVGKYGGAAFRELVETAQPLVRWWLDRQLAEFDLRHPEGKARAARELVPLLRSVPDALQRTEYARSVVQRLHLDEAEYLAMVTGQVPARPQVPAKAPPRSRSPQARVECEALKFALQHPDWTADAFERWVAAQRAAPGEPSGLAAEGKAIFTRSACVGCHTIRGVSAGALGPDLTTFGSRRTLAAGMLPNTVEAVTAWLKNPPALKPGAKMPPLGLTDAQARAVATYLMSLK